MKGFIVFYILVLSICLVYVSFNMESYRLCYEISQKEKSIAELSAKHCSLYKNLLEKTAPSLLQQKLDAHQIGLVYAGPQRLASSSSDGCEQERIANDAPLGWKSLLFGQKSAFAESCP